MTSEDGYRELRGYAGPPELTFMGETFRFRSGDLVALLRYAGTQPGDDDKTDEDVQSLALAAMYRLLEDCVEDFPRFAAVAISAKADVNDVIAAVQRIIEFCCARSHWPARRLLATIAVKLDEFDGNALMRSGRGLSGLSPREACNLALAISLDGRDEEDRAMFLEDLNYEGNPEAEAMAMVRKMQAAQAQAKAAQAKAAAGDGRDRLGPEGA